MGDEQTVTSKCRFERVLTDEECADMMANAPNQVHWAPGDDGVAAYWFEIETPAITVADGTTPPWSGAFYVRADSPESAQRHAAVVAERWRSAVQQGIDELQGRE